MTISGRLDKLKLALIAIVLLGGPAAVFAQTDEIQVYDGAIVDKGKFSVMLHSNFIASGHKDAGFPGGIIPNHSVNGTVEWAWGGASWFEQGLYFPVFTAYSKDRGGTLNGFKIRELFVRPRGDERTLVYGVNFEFSVNYNYWESRHITSEVRPIVGVHLKPVDLLFNPIVDTDYTGGFGNLEFVPATRIAYNLNDRWAVAVEEYADCGPLRKFLPRGDQFHEVWATFNRNSKAFSIETGVGFGVTPGADKLTFKFMISRDLN
jgi:hypothetical protein